MDAERRKELQKQFKDVGGFVSDVCRHGGPTVDELRALLARDEALERVEALPETLRSDAKWDRHESYECDLIDDGIGSAKRRLIAIEKEEIARRISRALGRD